MTEIVFKRNSESQSALSKLRLLQRITECWPKRPGWSFEGLEDLRARSATRRGDLAQRGRPLMEYVVKLPHLDQDRGCGDVGDRQLRGAAFAAALVMTQVDFSEDFRSGLLTPSQHFATQHSTSIRGNTYLIILRPWHIMTSAAVDWPLCQSAALSCVCVGPLSLSHRTEPRAGRGSGSDIRVLPGGVQRRAEGPRCGLPCWCKTFGYGGSKAGYHPGQSNFRAAVACRGSQCGVGTVGERCPTGVSQLLRLPLGRAQGSASGAAAIQVAQGRSAVVSAHSQWIPCAIGRTIAFGKDWRSTCAVVTQSTQPTIFGHHHPRDRWSLLREFRCRSASLPLAGRDSRSRDRFGNYAPGDDCHHRRQVSGGVQPTTSGAQVAQAPPTGAGESSTAEGIEEQGQDTAQDCHSAWRGCTCPAGLSPQAGLGAGSREPSDPRRGPQYCWPGCQSPASARHLRCWLEAVHADYRRESREVWTDHLCGLTLAGVQQDLFCLQSSAYGTSAARPRVDLSYLRHRTRSGPQRSQNHSRRRAGGEIKRFPYQWAGPQQRTVWSPGRSFNQGGTGR